ncbi:MAG: single-stranded DNA-binding protein [Proteobacteria bacterium]|nr:single-stranded DNA-binding protein [Pseudomonadota bacterium]MBU1586278.1 single-stranded DNA-binding protein [Pseudomonadota bacterium]MBU2453174.1 single-stranded DNA-binding protein [Pseudomonadota bacterium]MBU2630795.1 single-stranded DNA-binding protein [Pseudomonadota bacterium]
MGVNKIILVGRLGKDPESIENEGKSMTRFTLATNENYPDGDGGFKEKVEWHNIVAFNARAKACQKYIKKGSNVYIEGRNATRSYKKEGQTHYITEVQVKDIQFLDTKD